MTTVKVDYKRELPKLYRPGRAPEVVEVPELSFLMVDGSGDPNTSSEYREALEALFTLSYTIKFALKQAPDGIDFSVMPLEGLWWAANPDTFLSGDKQAWRWTAMIMQPDVVTSAVFQDALEAAAHKRPLPAASRIRLERFNEGLCAQIMYLGSYSDEGPTIARLHAFIAEQGCALAGKHHEIYLGDPRRSAPEKLRTIIRQPMARA